MLVLSRHYSLLSMLLHLSIFKLSNYLSKYLKPLAKKFTKNEWFFWSLSALITIASFLGVVIWFSFYEELSGWNRGSSCCMGVLALAATSLSQESSTG